MNKPNIYKINDSAAIWEAESTEEIKKAVDEIEEKRMIELLTAKGYCISKEKELVSDPTKEHTQATKKIKDVVKDSTNEAESQDLETYTLGHL